MSSFRETWRQMHKPMFWVIILCVLGWIALGVWLQERIGWPDRYGFHCHGRGCWIDDMWHSPALIHGGHWGEYALFAWLWSMPAFVITVLIRSKLRNRGAADLPPPDRL